MAKTDPISRDEVLAIWASAGGVVQNPEAPVAVIRLPHLWEFLGRFIIKSAEIETAATSHQPPSGEPESHARGCAIRTDGVDQLCTCPKADARRLAQVRNAGKANDRKFLSELGRIEAYHWHEGRKLADPKHHNPFKVKTP